MTPMRLLRGLTSLMERCLFALGLFFFFSALRITFSANRLILTPFCLVLVFSLVLQYLDITVATPPL